MTRVADLQYPNGFFQPAVNDREYVGGGHRMPHGSLPRFVPMHPDHPPSTVVFYAPLPDGEGTFGDRFRRGLRIARTECGCGWAWGRTKPGLPNLDDVHRPIRRRTGMDDVHVRGGHTTHTVMVRTRARRGEGQAA